MARRSTSLPTDLRPTPRELRWLAQIDRHGPQSSALLFAGTQDTHSCKHTALGRMKALRDARYLRLPAQQRQIAKADFHPHVYDLTPQGFEYLSYHQDLERHARPTGHWWHAFWVSSVTSAIEICATRAGLEYIPAARILAITGNGVAIPLRTGRIIPDQLFALRYPDGFRAFALELDRGTEPVRSCAARKSLSRSVAQYREVLTNRLHQHHYGLKSNLFVLWVFLSHTRQRQFRELLTSQDRQQLSHVCDADFPTWDVLQGVFERLRFGHR